MASRRSNGEHSIYQSGDRWHVQGWISGKRVRVSALRRNDAMAKWRQRVVNGLADAATSTALMDAEAMSEASVAQVLEQWFVMNEHRWSYSTRRGYRHDIDRKINPYLGRLPVKDLSVPRVELWQAQLQTLGCANSSIRQARGALRQAVDMMVRFELLPANKVALARPLPRVKAKPDHLSTDEVRQVLAAAEGPVERARWLLALTLGMRSGEVLALRWDDVDLDHDRPRLVVTGSLQFQTGVGLVRVKPKTFNSIRTLLLHPEHVEALRAVRVEQARSTLSSYGDFNPGNYVFISKAGSPIDPANDRKQWFALLERAGVRRVRRHDARHTAATLLLSAGAGIASVQKVLGHANISTTVDVYGHLTAEDGAEFVARLTSAVCDGAGPVACSS